MSNFQRNSLGERDAEQAITALKKGSYLLKYGRRGKPKFCPFRLSIDETTLVWFVGKEEKQLVLSHVSRIIPGQRTAIFQRYPRPEKEYQSFSLIYGNRSLDLICKDKDEAEIWFVALRALLVRANCQKWRSEATGDRLSSDSSSTGTQRNSQLFVSSSSNDTIYEDPRKQQNPVPLDNSQKRLGRAFSDFLLYREGDECSPLRVPVANSINSSSSGGLDDPNGRRSADVSRLSLSSAFSTSTQGLCRIDFDNLSDVIIWGEGIHDGLLSGGVYVVANSSGAGNDALFPKALETTFVLDAHKIACGNRHAVIVTKQGEIFSWGEGSGGKLGHGVEADVTDPKPISTLSGLNIESVACGEYHSCAVTVSGDLYTWGDGIYNVGLLGHGTEVGCWTPKKVACSMEGLHVMSISCGPWHTAAITSMGQLFTFGEGTFGALGHGDRTSTNSPREVKALKGLQTLKVSCGVWHTAAIVECTSELSSTDGSSTGKLFTWGDGDKGQLGHGDKEPRLVPLCVETLYDTKFSQVACGHSITVALTKSGQVYTMGGADYGQLGDPGSAGMRPTCIEGKIKNNVIEEIACGSHHIAILSSRSEVFTWGKGVNGQLGHGDNTNRHTPTLVQALKGRQVKGLACGSNFTAAICLHKQAHNSDHSICTGCRNPFSFRRKRHNCYNCGLVFCKACSSKKSMKASMAPNMNKPYRVCDDCFIKLNKTADPGLRYRPPRAMSGVRHSSCELKDKETTDPKPHGRLSRLASFDSFRWTGRRSNNDQVSPIRSRSFQCRSSYTSDSSSPRFEYQENIFASVPGSRAHSRSTSPLTSSPAHSMSVTSGFPALACHGTNLDDGNQANDDLSKEISILKEQVDVLTNKSQLLEKELERTSRQLEVATELAREEAEKCKAAKEAIKSLSNQLIEMAGKVPQGSSCRISGSFAESTSIGMNLVSSLSQLTS